MTVSEDFVTDQVLAGVSMLVFYPPTEEAAILMIPASPRGLLAPALSSGQAALGVEVMTLDLVAHSSSAPVTV